MMGFAALLAYISQCEKVNQAYTVSLSFVFLNVPKTLQASRTVSSDGALSKVMKCCQWFIENQTAESGRRPIGINNARSPGEIKLCDISTPVHLSVRHGAASWLLILDAAGPWGDYLFMTLSTLIGR